jgi:hypothetical protein
MLRGVYKFLVFSQQSLLTRIIIKHTEASPSLFGGSGEEKEQEQK